MKQSLKKFAVAVTSTTTLLGFGIAPSVAAAPNIEAFNNTQNWSQNYGVGYNVFNGSTPASPATNTVVEEHTTTTNWSHDWSNDWSHHHDNGLLDVDADVDVLDHGDLLDIDANVDVLDHGDLLDLDANANVGSYHHHRHHGGLLDLDLGLDLL